MASLHPNPQSHRVIQVVDCLSDTVVSVTQLEADTKKRFRWSLIATSLACFLLAGGSFYSALSTASENKAAYAAHMAQGKTSHQFRPARISTALEWGGSLAAALGLGCMIAAFATRRRNKSQYRAQVPWSLVDDVPDFELVGIAEGGAANLRVPPEMVVELVSGGGMARGDELCEQGRGQRDAEGWMELQLADVDRLIARSGQRSYQVEWTNRSNRAAVAAQTRIDRRFGAYLGACAAVGLFSVLLLDNLQPEPKVLFSDSMAGQQRFIAIKAAPAEDPISEPEDNKAGEDSGGNTTMADASKAGAAGTSGIETGTSERASLAIKRRQDAPTMSRKQVRSIAAHSGIMGTFSDRQIFASLTAASDFASGYESKDWYGGFEGGPVGHQVGELSGSYGNHIAALGIYGTSKVGNRLPGLHYGKGNCDSDEPCTGTSQTLGLRKRVASKPTFDLGDATSSGGLDKSIIRRHIKRKKLRIQHCYEKRLLVAPKLAGTLVASFSVGGNGKVIGSNANGMGDGALQDCVASVIASISFPKTDDSGIVNVRYPFTFHSVGD